MRRNRAIPLLCLASALVGTSALVPAVSASAAKPAPPAPLPLNLTPVDEIPAKEAAATAAVAAAKYPGTWGGTAWDSATKVLTINLAKPTGKQQDRRTDLQKIIGNEVSKAGLNVKLRYRSVPYSVDGRRALIASVLDQRTAWAGPTAARYITSGNVDAVTGKVSVYATGAVPALQSAAQRKFGTTVEVRQAAAGTDDSSTRYNDDAPWTAGNAIWASQFADRTVGIAHCTLGWNWRRWSDNQRYASTAGHCADPTVSFFHASTSQRIGYVGTKYLNQNEHIDFEYIRITSGSVDNTVWVGSQNTGVQRRVVGADNDGTGTGFTVCSSGANGGLVCGKIISRGGQATNAQRDQADAVDLCRAARPERDHRPRGLRWSVAEHLQGRHGDGLGSAQGPVRVRRRRGRRDDVQFGEEHLGPGRRVPDRFVKSRSMKPSRRQLQLADAAVRHTNLRIVHWPSSWRRRSPASPRTCATASTRLFRLVRTPGTS